MLEAVCLARAGDPTRAVRRGVIRALVVMARMPRARSVVAAGDLVEQVRQQLVEHPEPVADSAA